MTKTEITEQELSDMGVQVVRCPWLQRKAIATADGFVGVGETADSRETRVVLEHEKQHFRQSAFYTLATDDIQRLRSEAKVNRVLIRELCPYKTLRRLLRQGRTLSEISDFLEVTEEFVFEAYLFYREQNPHAFRGK